MKLQYICYDKTKKGFIQTRRPMIVFDSIEIAFFNVPEQATVVFTNEKKANLYRELKNGCCSVPAFFLIGEIKIAISYRNEAGEQKYICESFYAEREKDFIFVYPNGMDIPMQIVEIYSEIQHLNNELLKRDAKIEKMRKRIESYEKNGIELIFDEDGE